MPAAARLGDKAQVDSDAHGCPSCPHSAVGPIVVGSSDVTINGKPAARLDDLGVHAVCCGPNNFQIVKGSPTVYVNGKPLARQNDKTKHCGGTGPIIEGSPDTLIDDGAGDAATLAAMAMKARKINSEKSKENQKGKQKKISDQHNYGGGGAGGGGHASGRPASAGAHAGAGAHAAGPSGKPHPKPAPKAATKHKPAPHADPKHAQNNPPHKADAKHHADGKQKDPKHGGDQQKPQKDDALADARWHSATEVEHGTEVTMSVQAGKDLEGKSVRFVVEVMEDGHWKQHAVATGSVRRGKAEATVKLLHPAGEEGSEPAQVRFRAETE